MGNRKRSVLMTDESYDALTKYAASRHIPVSEAIRELINSGLSIATYSDEQDKIRGYMREEIENTLTPYLERLIKLQAKSTRASAIAMTTVIGMLTENYTDGRSHEEILARASKFAASYLKTAVRTEEEYLKEARDLLSEIYSSDTPDGKI